MAGVLESLADQLRARFGENAVLIFAISVTLLLVFWAGYAFFFKETSIVYEKYYEYRLARCADAVKAAAQITNSSNRETLAQAAQRFDELYYGELVLFEGRKLAGQMVQFRARLAPSNSDLTVDNILLYRSDAGRNSEIKRQSLEIAYACREEVEPNALAWVLDRFTARSKRQ